MISVRLRLLGFGKSPDRYGDQRACPERSRRAWPEQCRRVTLPSPATVATLLDHWAGELNSPTGMPGALAVERLLIIVNGRHIHHLWRNSAACKDWRHLWSRVTWSPSCRLSWAAKRRLGQQ